MLQLSLLPSFCCLCGESACVCLYSRLNPSHVIVHLRVLIWIKSSIVVIQLLLGLLSWLQNGGMSSPLTSVQQKAYTSSGAD